MKGLYRHYLKLFAACLVFLALFAALLAAPVDGLSGATAKAQKQASSVKR